MVIYNNFVFRVSLLTKLLTKSVNKKAFYTIINNYIKLKRGKNEKVLAFNRRWGIVEKV